MATTIFWSFPAHGHINPSLPLMAELVRRGEQVHYYSLELFRPAIEQTGAIFHSYGDDFPLFQFLTGSQDRTRTTYGLVLTSQWVLEHLLAEVQALRPDYIIFDALALWGSHIAQVLQLPSVCSQTSLAINFRVMVSVMLNVSSLFTLMRARRGGREYSQKCQAILHALSKTYHIKQMKPMDVFSQTGMLNIVYTSKLFQPCADSFDAQSYKFVGPALQARPDAPAFPFEQLDKERPLIYISLGTVTANRCEFFRECLRAFGESDWQVVMAIGKQTAPELLGAIPANCIVQDFVPQLEVLQRASIFVTHGGMNSVNEGLYYNVPLLVVPQGAEQPWIARRVEELGAGKQLSARNVTAERLRRVVAEVLSRPSYAQAAARVGESLRTAGGYQKAADEIQAISHLKI